MNEEFATAMRRSLALTRAGKPQEATRLIQEHLNGTGQGATDQPEQPRARASLGTVMRGLAQGTEWKPQAKAPLVVPGARFEQQRHSGAHGARQYHLYVPSCAPRDLRGLIVMLHGCTQTPADFALGTGMNAHAERHGMLVAYPEQTQGHNAQRCWNWFDPAHQSAATGEPALLGELASSVATEFGLQAGTTFAAGLSAGGAMAAILGATQPEVFRAVGVHSGLAPGVAQDVMSAFAAMRGEAGAHGQALTGPAIVFQGTNDSTVASSNAKRLTGQLDQERQTSGSANRRNYRLTSGKTVEGHPVEVWMIDKLGHAWSGGSREGSFADPSGPDASAEMMRFFNTMMDI